MLAFRHPREVVGTHVALEPELRGEPPLPLASDMFLLRVVRLRAACEFVPVVPLRLGRTQGTRDGEHQSKYGMCSTAESAWRRVDAGVLSRARGPSSFFIADAI